MDTTPLDDERSELVRDILALQRTFNAAAWRLSGADAFPPALTAQQFRVLAHVARTPGVVATQLSELLGVSAPTASGIVDRLVDKGLLLRAEDASDRRVRRLHLTAAGEDVLAQIRSATERMFGRLVPYLDTDLLVSVRDTYRRLLAAVPHEPEADGVRR